jgi:glycosyltransferase involved in cell wall biosynthesis
LPVNDSKTPRVVIAATTWAVNGVNVFSTNLARGLLAAGVPAHILMTEDHTGLVSSGERLMKFPPGVPFQGLPVSYNDGWGMHWGAMVRYLEAAAPCVYVPNYDWRHSCVCPRLSSNVVVVGVVHSDDPLHYDHVRRVGHTWNAVIAVSAAVAARTAEACPSVADKLVTIPIGVRLPRRWPLRRARTGTLRLVYHGALKQHQKRVLDLPRIVEAASALGVPVELSIAGAGPEEEALRAASAPLVERGLVRFLGVVAPDDMGALLEKQDVYLLASEFEGMPNALLEAMGRGCVPIVTRMTSGIPELIRDGDNGFLVPIGDAGAFAERLRLLAIDPARRRQMSKRAFETVRESRFRAEDMVRSYREVFDRAWQDMRTGRFVRRAGPIAPPPPEIAGVSVFPVALPHAVPDLGPFPSAEDADDYALQLRGGRRRPRVPRTGPGDPVPIIAARAALRGVRVFVAAPVWTATALNGWSEDLVRGLRDSGLDARLLLSEEGTERVKVNEPRMDRPPDLPLEELHIRGGQDTWGARWGSMVRLLETAAPCIYLPSNDWRHACVVPLLSKRVIVVGTMHAGGALYTENAARLGEYWNAIVASNQEIARHVRRDLPALEDRLTTIPNGVDVPVAQVAPRPDPGGRLVVVVLAGGSDADSAQIVTLVRALEKRPAFRVVVINPTPSQETALAGPRVEMMARPNRLQWTECCSSGDFIIACSMTTESRDMIVEAMGHGCIPVWVASMPPDRGLLRDGDTGIVAPDAPAAAAIQLERIAADPVARARLSAAAHGAARSVAGWRTEQMIEAYLELFHRLRVDVAAGVSRRTRGPLKPPPAQVGSYSVFSPALTFQAREGAFPTEQEALHFREESRTRRWFWPWQ